MDIIIFGILNAIFFSLSIIGILKIPFLSILPEILGIFQIGLIEEITIYRETGIETLSTRGDIFSVLISLIYLMMLLITVYVVRDNMN